MEREQKEREFRDKLKMVQQIDSAITKIAENFDAGILDIALAKYQNENLSYQLTPKHYKICPSTLQVKIDENNHFQTQKIKPKDVQFLLSQNEEEKFNNQAAQKKDDFFIQKKYDNEDNSQEQENLLIKKLIIKKDIDPIYNFGVFYESPALDRAKNNFTQILENALTIANLVQDMKNYNQNQKQIEKNEQIISSEQ